MIGQNHSTQNDPLTPVRIGAHSYLVGTAYQDSHGWTWEAPSSESAARRVRRILAEAPYPPTEGDAFGRYRLKVTRPRRQRKPSHDTIINRAKKAGASSVTIDGITYKFGEAIQTDIDRELAAFGRVMAKRDVKGMHRVVSKGGEYWYAWRGGPRVLGDYGTADFWASYDAAVRERHIPEPGKFRALGDALPGER